MLSESDLLLVRMIDRWFLTARDRVDTIGGWRDDPGERIFHGGWDELPSSFSNDTHYLFQRITTDHAKLDPTPIQDVYAAIKAWNDDHNALRVPEQIVLEATLERAEMVLGAVTHFVLKKELGDDPPIRYEYGITLDERNRLVSREGYDRVVDLSSSPVGWHILSLAVRVAPHRFILNDLESGYPGEWDARSTATNDLNHRLKTLTIRVFKRALQPLDSH